MKKRIFNKLLILAVVSTLLLTSCKEKDAEISIQQVENEQAPIETTEIQTEAEEEPHEEENAETEVEPVGVMLFSDYSSRQSVELNLNEKIDMANQAVNYVFTAEEDALYNLNFHCLDPDARFSMACFSEEGNLLMQTGPFGKSYKISLRGEAGKTYFIAFKSLLNSAVFTLDLESESTSTGVAALASVNENESREEQPLDDVNVPDSLKDEKDSDVYSVSEMAGHPYVLAESLAEENKLSEEEREKLISLWAKSEIMQISFNKEESEFESEDKAPVAKITTDSIIKFKFEEVSLEFKAAYGIANDEKVKRYRAYTDSLNIDKYLMAIDAEAEAGASIRIYDADFNLYLTCDRKDENFLVGRLKKQASSDQERFYYVLVTAAKEAPEQMALRLEAYNWPEFYRSEDEVLIAGEERKDLIGSFTAGDAPIFVMLSDYYDAETHKLQLFNKRKKEIADFDLHKAEDFAFTAKLQPGEEYFLKIPLSGKASAGDGLELYMQELIEESAVEAEELTHEDWQIDSELTADQPYDLYKLKASDKGETIKFSTLIGEEAQFAEEADEAEAESESETSPEELGEENQAEDLENEELDAEDEEALEENDEADKLPAAPKNPRLLIYSDDQLIAFTDKGEIEVELEPGQEIFIKVILQAAARDNSLPYVLQID